MTDKHKHALAGLAIAFVATVILGFLINPPYDFLIGWGIAGLIGAGKELIYDKLLGKGTPSTLDFWVTLLGGFVGSWIGILLVDVIS